MIRHGHRDPVTPLVRRIVLERDGYHCVAPKLDPDAGICRNTYGHPITSNMGRQPEPYLQLDHVRGQPPIGELEIRPEGGRGKRAPSDPEHLVTVCVSHHQHGWATSHRPLLREYLAGFRPTASGYVRG